MNIKKLTLKNFRNYENLTISFDESINVFFGQNAQGKTNILEALYIASTGKSHRTNIYHDLIQYDQSGFEIYLETVVDNRNMSIKIKYSKEKGRLIEINGIKREKLSDILGTFNMIFFSPETLEVVKGSPAVRRRFLDILLCQTNRSYLHCLQQYNMLLKQKSAALKKMKIDKKYEDVLPIWNNQLSLYGGKISYQRMKAITEINSLMKSEIQQITENSEFSELIYTTYCDYDDKYLEGDFQRELSEKLTKGLEKERVLAQCIYGPHRDDFEILLNSMNSRQFCSQGQQRTLALSLIIAELLYVEKIRGEKPVLLLDDVMSELDMKRQEYLLKGLYNVQTIITTTDDNPFKNMKDKKIKSFFVEQGCVFPES